MISLEREREREESWEAGQSGSKWRSKRFDWFDFEVFIKNEVGEIARNWEREREKTSPERKENEKIGPEVNPSVKGKTPKNLTIRDSSGFEFEMSNVTKTVEFERLKEVEKADVDVGTKTRKRVQDDRLAFGWPL
jgi:hypothetical protein